MATAQGKRVERARLEALLQGMACTRGENGDFEGMTGAELRSLVDAGFAKLDGQCHESLDVSYFLESMEATGALACGEIDVDSGPDFLVSIDRLELPGGDPKRQVKLLRMTLGCDDIYDLDCGGIGVWWD